MLCPSVPILGAKFYAGRFFRYDQRQYSSIVVFRRTLSMALNAASRFMAGFLWLFATWRSAWSGSG